MFGRKSKHIAFLEFENKLLRRKYDSLEKDLSDCDDGNVVKFMLQHPEYIQNNQITIYPDMIDSVVNRTLVRVDSVRGNKYTLRLNHTGEE